MKETENGFCQLHGVSKELSGFLGSFDVPIDLRDLGLICQIKKHNCILSDLRIQSWIILKKCSLHDDHFLRKYLKVIVDLNT